MVAKFGTCRILQGAGPTLIYMTETCRESP